MTPKTSGCTELPLHPTTGLRALGMTSRGPVWPILGGGPTVPEQRADTLKSAQAVLKAASDAGRELTADENVELQKHVDAVKAFDVQIKAAQDSARLVGELGQMGQQLDQSQEKGGEPEGPLTLGEHFVKHAGDRLKQPGTVSAPEWTGDVKAARLGGLKAATDTQATTATQYGPVLTQINRNIVQAVRQRLTIADLCGSGTLDGNAVTYFIEGAMEGSFTTVAEGALKPQIHFVDPTTVTDKLTKLAAFFKLSDEMLEDLAFVVSNINGRALYQLGLKEEQQILSATGTGTDLVGILNRSGVQTIARGNAASGETAAEAIFRGMTAVTTGSGLDADAVVMNPLDYQTQRLAKDANGQYYGGGFFQGEYGVGSVLSQPNLWGLRTVVTPSIAQGTALVGAFSQAATVYRKGGVRVESTNSHSDDFTHNLNTVRVEERIGLAVPVPSGFAKVNLAVGA